MNFNDVEWKRQEIIQFLKSKGLTKLKNGERIEDLPLMSLSILKSQNQ